MVAKKKAKPAVKESKKVKVVKIVKKVAKKAVVVKKGKVALATKVKVKKAVVAKKVAPKAKIEKAAPKAKLEKVTKPYTKSELYKVLSDRTNLTKSQISGIFEELVGIVKLHLQKDGPLKFTLPGLLKMNVKNVPAKKAQKGINPFTKEPTVFKAKPASRKVKVAALKALKDLV